MKKKRTDRKMDRISDLPDPIVHHIMSFLPTLDVTKVSVVSKRFLFLWSSFPVIEFDESTFDRITYQGMSLSGSTTDEFLDHIRNSISLRRIDTVISEFRVKANLKGITVDHRLNSAISFAVDNGVKSMDLNLGFENKYMFPYSFASRSINVLRLTGLKLDVCNLIQSCPFLKTLSLTSCLILGDVKFSSKMLMEIELHCCVVKLVKINAPKLHSFSFDSGKIDPKPCRIDVLECENIVYLSLNNVVNGLEWVEEHTSRLGKLETFILNGCQDIDSISIWNEKVERIEIGNCPLLSSVKVIAYSLKSFEYKGTDQNRVSKINLIASKNIKQVYIENAGITDEWLEGEIPRWCCLESLKLKGCNLLKKIVVIHEKLQILELLNCVQLEEAEIDTPQLVSFVHFGNMIEFSQFVTRSICTATLKINPWITYNNESFYRWRNLLSFFGHCKALRLICDCEEELIIPGDLRERLVPPLYDLQCLEVYIKSLEVIEADLVDSLLWLSPLPNTISIFSGSCFQLQMIIKFAYDDETIKEEEDKSSFCCTSKPVKCWRHNLRRLDIQTNGSSTKYGLVELQKYFRTNAMKLEKLSCTIGFAVH